MTRDAKMDDGPGTLWWDTNIPLNPNGVGSLLTRWRLEPCSGLRAEPGHTDEGEKKGEEEREKSEEERKKQEFHSAVQLFSQQRAADLQNKI